MLLAPAAPAPEPAPRLSPPPVAVAPGEREAAPEAEAAAGDVVGVAVTGEGAALRVTEMVGEGEAVAPVDLVAVGVTEGVRLCELVTEMVGEMEPVAEALAPVDMVEEGEMEMVLVLEPVLLPVGEGEAAAAFTTQGGAEPPPEPIHCGPLHVHVLVASLQAALGSEHTQPPRVALGALPAPQVWQAAAFSPPTP